MPLIVSANPRTLEAWATENPTPSRKFFIAIRALTWDRATLAKTVIGAGVGTVIVQGLIALYRDRRRRKRQAAYMAVRLAVILEFYTSSCAAFIEEKASGEPSHAEEFPVGVVLPELPAYPDDADGWRSIDHVLAGQCLNFRNKIHESQRIVNSTHNCCREQMICPV